jgi:chromosome partitioning protein
MSSHPVTQITGQFTRFLFGAVRYTQRDPAVVIAVLNLKGGCGKSTIAINLACELAGNGDSVLLLDNDSQGTASLWLSHGRLPVQGRFMPLENDADGERLMRTVAERKERYVVLDAPAHVGAAALAAGRIADLVLVPVTASGVDLAATRAVVDLIRQARVLRRSDAPKCMIVPSKIDRRTDAGRRTDENARSFGEDVGPAIHQRTAFVESFGAGQWIGDYAPQSPAHYDITSLAIAVKRTLRI